MLKQAPLYKELNPLLNAIAIIQRLRFLVACEAGKGEFNMTAFSALDKLARAETYLKNKIAEVG